MPHTYDWPRPSLTVDAIVATDEAPRRVLFIRRGSEPFRGKWALPGGFVEEQEPLEAAARRELAEETGLALDGVAVEQFRAYGTPHRDPRGWTVSVVFAAVLGAPPPGVRGQDDAAEARFFAVDALPPLAFDHATIVAEGLAWLEKRKECRS